MKRRQPSEIIESDKTPKREQVYIKYPGEELIDIAKRRRGSAVFIDYSKIEKCHKSHNRKPYTMLHTHPSGSFFMRRTALPTPADILDFLYDENLKKSVIVQQEKKSGKIRGSITIKKTKDSPTDFRTIDQNCVEYKESLKSKQKPIPTNISYKEFKEEIKKQFKEIIQLSSYEQFEQMIKKNNLRYRITPRKDYKFDKNKFAFVEKEK